MIVTKKGEIVGKDSLDPMYKDDSRSHFMDFSRPLGTLTEGIVTSSPRDIVDSVTVTNTLITAVLVPGYCGEYTIYWTGKDGTETLTVKTTLSVKAIKGEATDAPNGEGV